VWCWTGACCIRSSQLVCLARPMPTVCGLKMTIWRRWLGTASGLVPSLLHFARFHRFINLGDSCCNTVAYSSWSSDDVRSQGYLAINIVQFNSLAILTQNQIPLRCTLDFPGLPHHPPGAPRYLSKSNPTDGFTSARGRTHQTVFPNIFFMCTTGALSPSTGRGIFDWAAPALLVHPLVLTNQVVQCVSQCF